MSASPQPSPMPFPRRTWPALLGLALTIAGPFAFFALLDYRWVQRTAGPALPLMAAGAALALWAAWRDRRIWVRGVAVANTLLLGLMAAGIFGMSALPAATHASAARAPDVILENERGERVVLSDLWQRGPVLLVFYRGFW